MLCGYAPLTARRHLRSAEHFAHWLIAWGCQSPVEWARFWSDSVATYGEAGDTGREDAGTSASREIVVDMSLNEDDILRDCGIVDQDGQRREIRLLRFVADKLVKLEKERLYTNAVSF